jgi:hypothetical protein
MRENENTAVVNVPKTVADLKDSMADQPILVGGSNGDLAPYLQEAKRKAVETLLRPNRNIVGIGVGKKTVDGEEKDCLRIYVVSKLDLGDLYPRDRVPPTFRAETSGIDVPTDVIQIGSFWRRGRRPKTRETRPPLAPNSPIQPGSRIRVKTSAPNVNEGFTGTLGAVLTDGTDRYMLSCNHVLRVNGRVPDAAHIVSAEFVGTEDIIAKPDDFVPLSYDEGNPVDCAVALLPKGPSEVLPKGHREVQAGFLDGLTLSPKGPIAPVPNMKVTKVGATTYRTDGTIVDVNADLYVDYSFGTFLFEQQIMIEGGTDGYDFASGGDSGSIVVETETNRPTAMIFAASGGFAVACPLTTLPYAAPDNGVIYKLNQKMKCSLSFVTQ